MTRRRNQNIELEIDLDNPLVSNFLKNSHYDLLKETNKNIECPICLESLLCCKNCYALLLCGHSLHITCLMNTHSKKCPLCRN